MDRLRDLVTSYDAVSSYPTRRNLSIQIHNVIVIVVLDDTIVQTSPSGGLIDLTDWSSKRTITRDVASIRAVRIVMIQHQPARNRTLRGDSSERSAATSQHSSRPLRVTARATCQRPATTSLLALLTEAGASSYLESSSGRLRENRISTRPRYPLVALCRHVQVLCTRDLQCA